MASPELDEFADQVQAFFSNARVVPSAPDCVLISFEDYGGRFKSFRLMGFLSVPRKQVEVRISLNFRLTDLRLRPTEAIRFVQILMENPAPV